MPEFNVQQSYDQAVQHHQSGRLLEAEQLYQQILKQNPNHAGAMHYLGVIALQTGRTDAAVDLIAQALALNPKYDAAHTNLGNALRKQGRLDAAIAAYRQSISLNPNVPEAHRSLGTALREKGDLDGAIAAYRQAISLRPNYADAYNNLGNALKAAGKSDNAISAFRQAIALNPNLPEAHNNLGNALTDSHQLDEAIAAYRRAIALRPDYADAHSNLALGLREKGQIKEAIAECRRAIQLKPDSAEAHGNLGIALRDNGQLDEAIAECRLAISLNPNLPEAQSNLGQALTDKGQFDEAIRALHRAIALRPEYPDAQMHLGNALKGKGQMTEAVAALRQVIALKPESADAYSSLGDVLKEMNQPEDAIAAYQQAIALNPNLPETRNNLGNALRDKAQLDEAIAEYRRALTINPTLARAHSNLILTLQYHPAYDAQSIAEELDTWNRRHAEPLRKNFQPHPNDRDPDRRLRIGYFSPDFREHVVGRNLLPLFRNHDHRQFEITCYAQVLSPDASTREFEKLADRWRSTIGMSDEQFAWQIGDDQIDILVDLALHSAGSRLPVFARRPAPVQATFAGYPGSTGLTTIDYRLSDPYLDPPGMDESIYSEKTIRLPDSFWCYEAADVPDVSVNPLPARKNGFITFGCLNNFCKINADVLALWAKVLQQTNDSRLLLMAPPGSHRQRTIDQLSAAEIDPARIEFVPRAPTRKYLELYHRIDLALDTFPWNGHSTSLDSYWMGVPVISRVGQTAVSRAGWCQLSNLGLSELAGQTPEDFIRIAVELAKDLPRLENLRMTLRQRMENSPLMDAPKFARNIEAALRRMWQTWCAR
jgi:protein O-GlcNAc transferase